MIKWGRETYEELVSLLYDPNSYPNSRGRRWRIGLDRMSRIRVLEDGQGNRLVLERPDGDYLLGLPVERGSFGELQIEVYDARPRSNPLEEWSVEKRLQVCERIMRSGAAGALEAALGIRTVDGVPAVAPAYSVPWRGYTEPPDDDPGPELPPPSRRSI